MNCKDCKHFCQSSGIPNHLGSCDLELPPWLLKTIGADTYGLNTTVRVDDTCSFAKGYD